MNDHRVRKMRRTRSDGTRTRAARRASKARRMQLTVASTGTNVRHVVFSLSPIKE